MDDAVLFHDILCVENVGLPEAVFELCAEFVQRYMALRQFNGESISRRLGDAEVRCIF